MSTWSMIYRNPNKLYILCMEQFQSCATTSTHFAMLNSHLLTVYQKRMSNRYTEFVVVR